MTVRIGDTVPAPRRRDDEPPAEGTGAPRRVLSRATQRKTRFAWLSHLDTALQKARS
ncbi:MAG TPA: hypothetical protein VJ870_00075 [Amycolatopsis sp.]|nr:hypothetical protein [Amycolatopsis sp.]